MCHKIVNKGTESRRLVLSNSRQGQVAGFQKHNNKLSGSVKCGEFLDFLRTYIIFSRRTLFHGVSWLGSWLFDINFIDLLGSEVAEF